MSRNTDKTPISTGNAPKGKTMKSRLFKTVLSAACAMAPLVAVPAGTASAQTSVSPAQDIVLSIGRGELITVPGTMADIFVSNDTVADVQVKSQRQLYVFGKSGGETTIYASNQAGDIIWSANIRVGSNIDSIDQMLSLAMPEADVRVATMGSNTVLLTGTVAAPEDASEAERLVSAFVGEQTNVISRLRMATPLQVNLRVRFAEVSRSLVRNLGANLTTIDGTGGFLFGLNRGRPAVESFVPGSGALGMGTETTVTLPDGTEISGTTILPNTPQTTIGAVGEFLGLDIAGALDLGERRGLVTTLSQPNLTALSGETAEFLAGGEFPIPLSQGLGTTTVEYKNYGVSLAYSPTVLANGRISLRVRPEVSELSSQGAVTLNGFQIPALTIRRAETSVELGSGESIMIAGLLSNNAQHTIDQAPGVGDIPILGNLFRSTDFQRGETELVIVITPYLVEPVDDRDIHLPTDGFAVPDAASQFLFGQETNGTTGGQRPMPRAANPAPDGPNVSVTDQNPAALVTGESAGTRTAAAATPGFSIANGE
ncbi:type II and III secretion system protein family protein [Aurantiacibacter poecillastricola]|uniref:type II and III secretion system protein family protein n=1 Tax=Aurantiacibacter poecillastricola TaxID=3064385 RepID=UPI00273ED62C|nr:type II and III secretion system protein family protein [Aurantiacibacter sp. 219JJ12-13]MDP5262828.1 type II and III secretion system protein family protein [Aurantiacibacter sp. 219JJ12-13]